MMMTALLRRIRAANRDDAGMTLAELMVSVALLMVVVTIFTTVVLSIYTAVIRQQARTETNDQARLAIEQLDREIRSGSLIYQPVDEPASTTCGGKTCVRGHTLRVLTQANATTRTPPEQCVQWAVDGGKLWRRAWAPGSATSIDGWRMVAEGVVNREPGVNVTSFASPNGRVVDVTLVLNTRYGKPDPPKSVRVNTSIAIRNSGSGDPCSPVPTS